ncbi:hypothetical protein K491DRAFT_720857 [Lophiostoma macrostomum CBS 122681]|uniref:protein-ribulosamine 3-kinase n=1 Tax=Lophiostoma macrostomum CBS 122681 TaxID=1314788 RepID=A0A6A6SRG4_9PLEO|nr:hypothetical protein K491DRAFT_720857 [Lophiostoma macrostomum CBS 122681]
MRDMQKITQDLRVSDAVMDLGLAKALPTGCRVLSTKEHGSSFWGKTGRIEGERADGSRCSFFIKVMQGETGLQMAYAEFVSMSEISKVTADFAPKPVAWGSYESIPDTHFFLCEYREMTPDMPDPDQFTAQLAALHQNSKSPTGRFGFPITTFAGNLPQYTSWESSWEVFFEKSLRQALNLEIAAKGHDSVFDVLLPLLFEKVIPRLLRPLETEGRSVRPSLVHGDLWFRNAAIDNDDGKPLIFDACCFYAHNEYELGQWRPVCNRFGAEYVTAYHEHMPISKPEEDYNGRIDLYKLRFNVHVSALFHDDPRLREQMLGDIRDLVKRYG